MQPMAKGDIEMNTTRMEDNAAQPWNKAMIPEVWRYIFDAIEEPAFLHDAQFRVLLANRAYCLEADVIESEALGKPYWEVFPPGIGPLPGCKDAVSRKGHTGSQEEVSVREKIFLSKSYVVCDSQGKPSYFLHLLSDITERRLAEESVRIIQARFGTIFNQSPLGIALIDSLTGQIYEVNPRFAEIVGRTVEEMATINWMGITHPDDVQEDLDNMTLLNAGEIPGFKMDKRYIRPDGSVVWVGMTIAPLRMEQNISPRHLCMIDDITERKLTEDTIRQQQELTTQIIETIPLRVFWKDRDLRYLGCNTLFAKDAGLTRPDELIGKTDFDMGWKDQAEIYRADDRLVMDSNTPKLSFDEPQTTQEGRHIWLRTSKVPLHTEIDESIGLLGVYEDITDYKQVQLSLLESEERFRKAFQYSAIGMALVGLDGHWLKVNNSLCQIVGYPEQELLCKTFQDITYPDDLQSDLNFVAQLLAGEIDHYQMEKRYFHKDGHVVWIRMSISLIRDAQDNPIHFASQIEDITEDKLAAETLRKTNIELSLFRKLLDNSSDAIEVIDPITARFLDVNERACRDLGYSREELLSMNVFDVDPSINPDTKKMIEEQMAKSGATRFEGAHRRKDGTTFAVEVSIGTADLDKPYWLCVVRDITERKLAEEKIRKLNEELEAKVQERTKQLRNAQEELVRKEKLAVLGQIAGSVGHELRNPLGVMSNAVYFLQTVLANADEITKEYLNIIKDEIAGSERIVSDLLDSVRTNPPQIQTVGIAELIEQILSKYTVPSSVTVKLDIPAALPPLRVDAMQIQQVFRNLISNGVEAMQEGGTLEIRVLENKQDGTVTVSVCDSGIGMAPELLAKLFQPLFTTKARGIGLGLVIVKNLTQANGGKVEVQSEPGKGTTFAVIFPT
jgi:PAS domain S-box-containing protein